MKTTSKGGPSYFINGNTLFPKIPFSPQTLPTPHNQSISRIHQNSADASAYYDPKQQNGMTFGFGLQVMKVPTQLRERTNVKPITISPLYPSKKPNAPKLPPSANKLHRDDVLEPMDLGNGYKGIKEMPNIKLGRPPKLPQISKVQETEKPKAYSQNDISTRTRSDFKRKLDKLGSTGRKKEIVEKNSESSYSIYGLGTETKRGIESVIVNKMKEMDDTTEKEQKPAEIKSLNIVQRKLNSNSNRDNWFDFKDLKNQRRESALGSYLSKALHEVTNLNSGPLTQGISPRENLGLEIKGQQAMEKKEDNKEKINEKKVRVRRVSGSEKGSISGQEQIIPQIPGPVQGKSEVKIGETGSSTTTISKTPGELKKMLKRPNSKVTLERKKKEKTKSAAIDQMKEEEDTSKIEEYRFDDQSDGELSLDEYLKAKKENYETEEMDYDYTNNMEVLS